MKIALRTFGITAFVMVFALVGLPAIVTASEFTEALTEEYFDQAQLQYYYSDDPFAVKARAADEGKNVLPDDPATRELNDQDREELTVAHGQLMPALDGNFRTQNPKQAARAQVMFDCWLSSAAKAGGRDWKCVEVCKAGFEKAMAAWTPPAKAAPPPPMAKPEPKPAPQPAPAPRSFIVFFDWDRSDVNSAAQQVVETAAAYANERGHSNVRLTGHADRSGAARYNMGLSQRRADAVKAMLVRLGFAPGGVSVTAQGESQPLVDTADGVREPRNRRVEIRF